MTERTVNIHLDGTGSGTIEVNGQPLRGVRSLTLNSEAGQRPEITLELLLHDISTVAEARVLVTDDVAATLVALGWTPPPEQEVPDAAAHG